MIEVKQTVSPLGVAVFGPPEACPKCGGQLAPCFGVTVDEAGNRRPVLDPSVAQCVSCRTMFRTAPRA